MINVSGALKKTVNLTPFNVASAEDAAAMGDGVVLYEAQFANDIIFGGWGSDFLHGGSGDDAISGAEALPQYYERPVNPGDILSYGEIGGREFEFAAYDENNPMSRVFVSPNADNVLEFATADQGEEFILNFDHLEGPSDLYADGTQFETVATDGDDILFGDLGNDWLVGGTGRDTLYGGWGDDLLNADDNLDTHDGLNDMTDTHPSYEDRAFGGAGRDILISNTGGDRLIDWSGEFNSYLVPFGPFGKATISRDSAPSLRDFLYTLSEAQGADPTRADDTDSDPDRNGEPEGELGLIEQGDWDWRGQTGAPDDPQPGNIGGGSRDVRIGAQAESEASGSDVDSGSLENAAADGSTEADDMTDKGKVKGKK